MEIFQYQQVDARPTVLGIRVMRTEHAGRGLSAAPTNGGAQTSYFKVGFLLPHGATLVRGGPIPPLSAVQLSRGLTVSAPVL